MEPIEASLANSSSLGTDPFESDETNFIFGTGNNLSQTPSDTQNQTPVATAAQGGPAESAVGGDSQGGFGGGGGVSLTEVIIIVVAAMLGMKYFVK